MKLRYLILILLLVKGLTICAQSIETATKQYADFFPEKECNKTAFNYAMIGYQQLLKDGLLSNPRYLTIVDFNRPSNQYRLFVLDLQMHKLALKSIVAHGVGSDPDSMTIPYRFGNRDGSRMSSVGFYITGETYFNHRPDDSVGLCLFGMDKGYNDSAAIREIVVHYGASERSGNVYVTDSGAARSYGCPALPLSTNGPIISMIKGGSCLFIYSDKVPAYPKRSTVLNGRLNKRIRQQGPPPNNCNCDLTRR